MISLLRNKKNQLRKIRPGTSHKLLSFFSLSLFTFMFTYTCSSYAFNFKQAYHLPGVAAQCLKKTEEKEKEKSYDYVAENLDHIWLVLDNNNVRYFAIAMLERDINNQQNYIRNLFGYSGYNQLFGLSFSHLSHVKEDSSGPFVRECETILQSVTFEQVSEFTDKQLHAPYLHPYKAIKCFFVCIIPPTPLINPAPLLQHISSNYPNSLPHFDF
ncbi:hypothetical protein CI610_00222 [invertebrate metagenome]|uniref:Uncharacterized protein n=1 Tax=invertebrate metagenome TaxID=1711999 RepID=A0A2H9TC71_9ZZZZ